MSRQSRLLRSTSARGLLDTIAMNDRVAHYRDRYSERFPVAFGTVDPLQGMENGMREIERMATSLSLQGVSWHHRMQGTWIAERAHVRLPRGGARLRHGGTHPRHLRVHA